jgi:hypothetical protein
MDQGAVSVVAQLSLLLHCAREVWHNWGSVMRRSRVERVVQQKAICSMHLSYLCHRQHAGVQMKLALYALGRNAYCVSLLQHSVHMDRFRPKQTIAWIRIYIFVADRDVIDAI